MEKILLIDDEQAILDSLYRLFRNQYEVFYTTNPYEGLKIVSENQIALILADQRMPEMTGVEFLEKTIAIDPKSIRILLTAYSEPGDIINAINRGSVYKYITKPWDPPILLITVQRAVENYLLFRENENLIEKLKKANELLSAQVENLEEVIRKDYPFEQMLGQSPQIKEIFKLTQQILDTETTILILGETGTGKGLLAKTIHLHSKRKDKKFTIVNCSAIPETLLESELFGHVKGAFTGAIQDRKGLFEISEGGTIFLDEIGDTSLGFQAKLLHVLQNREFKPVGSDHFKACDVRVISATNKNLLNLIQENKFREDLYYRLAVFPIVIPPLRERKTDISILAKAHLTRLAEEMGRKPLEFSKEAIELLISYHWPGNVRELENVIERSMILSKKKRITTDDLPLYTQSKKVPTRDVFDFPPEGIDIEIWEKNMIQQALKISKSNKSKAAKLLGLSRSAIRHRISKYRIK